MIFTTIHYTTTQSYETEMVIEFNDPLKNLVADLFAASHITTSVMKRKCARYTY